MQQILYNKILNGLHSDTIDIQEFHNHCNNEEIEYFQAEQFLYSKNKEIRFEWFIALYDAMSKKDFKTQFKIFREAYCSSNNIFNQIMNCQYSFNLKGFLKMMENQGVQFVELMNETELKYYNELPKRFKIYRGLSNAEHKSNDYGISWTLIEDEAKEYVYFDKNNVENGKGGLVNKDLNKDEILTVFCVREKCEIIYLM